MIDAATQSMSIAHAAEVLDETGEVVVRSKVFAENLLRLHGSNENGYRWTPNGDGTWLIEAL